MSLTKHFVFIIFQCTRQVIYCMFKKRILVLFLFMEFSSVKTVVTNLHFQIFYYMPENSTGCSNRNEVPISFQNSSQVFYRFCSTQLLFLFLRWYGSQTHKEKFGYRKLKTHKKKITTRQTFLLLSLFKTVCLLQLSIIYWTATSTSAPSLTMFFCQ